MQAKSATSVQRVAYRWALRACRVGGQKARLADLLVLRAVRQRFGLNRLRLAYVGGTSASPAALDWARSLGIAIQRVDEAAEGAEWFDNR
jgi:long-subunit acyl-CoA synthetase (AMP-forming)